MIRLININKISDWKIVYMFIYRLPTSEIQDFTNKYGIIEDLQSCKEKLNKKKQSIELLAPNEEKMNEYQKLVQYVDRYKSMRKRFMRSYGVRNVTNAWIKMYEILHTFDSVFFKRVDKISTMHLCEAPGAFIMVFDHFIKTHHKDMNYDWKAQSLISEDAIGDDYGIIKDNPDKWDFGITGDGDISSTRNMKHYGKIDKVDIVTSDVGSPINNISVRGEAGWNHQEEILLPLHYCQVITSLHILKKGGCAIFKTFTFFESCSVSILSIICKYFEEVYICKPLASRPANSEVYIVAINFKYVSSDILAKFRRRVSTLKRNTGSMLNNRYLFTLTPDFEKSIIKCHTIISNQQMSHIDFNSKIYNEMKIDFASVSKREINKNRKSQAYWINKYKFLYNKNA